MPELLTDTSAIVDGRVLGVARTGLITAVLVHVAVVADLRILAADLDRARRRRGHHGLDIVAALRATPQLTVTPIEDPLGDNGLIGVAGRRGALLLTADPDAAARAEELGVRCCNVHTLAEALRPLHTNGDNVRVAIAKAGAQPGQGVGFLRDGSMVVVAGAADAVGTEVDARVTKTLQTSMGRMLFAVR